MTTSTALATEALVERLERRKRELGIKPSGDIAPREFDDDLIPDLADGHTHGEPDEIGRLIDGIDIVEAYRRWCGKMEPKIGRGQRESIMVSCPVPDHADANPSAWLSLDKDVWYCAVCARGGDQYDLAAYHFGFDVPGYKRNGEFPDLRRRMAEDLGYEINGGGEPAALAARTTRETRQRRTKAPSKAVKLVAMAQEHYELGRTHAGEPYAVSKRGPNVALQLRGGNDSLRADLARRFYEANQQVAGSSALADAMKTLEGYALQAEENDLPVRVGQIDTGIVLDRGTNSGEVCVINETGWRLQPRSPLTFRRTELTGPLNRPDEDGDLDLLRQLVNVTDDSWELLVGWLACALFPNIAHPIAFLRGEQGSGKSTTARMVSMLIDPSSAPIRSAPRVEEQWAVQAAGSWIVALDNVSGIPAWLSDALCRGVTGDGYVRRRLYSDSGISVLHIKKPILLTSIDAGALKGDLADRMLPIDLEPISGTRRRPEMELEGQFAELQPRILSGLLQLVSGVVKHLPDVKLTSSPRMADAARVFAAVDAMNGTKCLPRYEATVARMAAEVVEGDLVAEKIQDLVRSGSPWEGTATELFEKITSDPPPRTWPRDARSLSKHLRGIAPTLRREGIDVRFAKSGSRRLIKILSCP